MKKLFLSLAVLLSGALLTAPSLEAKGKDGRGSSVEQGRSGQRPGRGGSSESHRGGGNSAPVRPGSGGSNFAPGNGNGGYGKDRDKHNDKKDRPGMRPGNQNHGGVRPGGGQNFRPAPAAPSRPAPGVPSRPGTARPGNNRPSVLTPPTRPGRPVYNPWTRPIPPAVWRPAHRYNVVTDILGMAFGLTINTALDHLYNAGYNVDGYGSQEIYLHNVSERGYRWDDATLYFSGNGLVRSQFYDSTSGYNLNRYNGVYNSLMNSYGAPVSQTNSGGQLQATWFGYNGEYVSLQYALMNSPGGYRYFTILTYGN